MAQPFIFTRYPLPGGRIRTTSGPGVHLHSLSAARWAYPDREWSRRSSSLAIRRQEGVSGPRVAQPFIFTRYPLPGGRIRTASGPAVNLHSLSAAKKAYPDPEWPSRSSSLAVRCQESVSGPWMVQPFIFTRCPPPGRRIRTPSGPAVHLHSLCATGKAYPDRDWPYRSSSLAIRRQEGVSGPRVAQPFIFTRYPLPGGRIRTASGPAVNLHSLSAAKKAYPDPEWPSRSSSLAVRCQEGVSGPWMVQPFIFTRCPPPGRRIRTPSGPAVHLHSLCATGKAYPDRDWPYRSSSLAIRHQEGVSGPRVAQPFIFTRYPLPGGRIRTASGPAVNLDSLSAAKKVYPDPEWPSRSSSLAVRLQEGVSGPRVVQPFIFTRSPLPGRRIQTPDGPAVHLHSLCATGKAYPDRDWPYRSSSLAIRRQEGVSGPRVAQPFIFIRYPLPGGRIRTASGPGVHLHSLSAAKKAYPDPEWPSRSSSLAIRCQVGVSGPRVVQPLIFTRYPRPRRRIRTPSGQVVHLHSLSAARKAYPDPGWSSRSSSLAVRLQEGVSGPRVVQPFIFTHCAPPVRRIQTATGPTVHLHSLSAAKKAYPDPEWPSRSSSLAIRCQVGVSGPRVVQPLILTRYPRPRRCIRTPSGQVVHLHSLSASRKAYRDPEWSSRSSSPALRCQEGVSRPRMVQPFIFTHCAPPVRRIQTATGPTVHLRSLSAAKKAYPDPEWPSRSSSFAIRCQVGVSGPRVVQAFLFTRYPPPRRRIRTPSGPAVPLHSLPAARKASPDPGRSSRSSSVTIRHQEGVSGPRVAQPFLFTRYPPPGRRRRIPGGPAVHLQSLSATWKAYPDPEWSSRSFCSLSAAKKAYPDPEWPSRSSSLAIRCQVGVSGPRVVQPLILTRYPRPRRCIRTPSGQVVHLHSLSASRKAYRDPEWSSRSSSPALRCQEGVSRPRMVQPFIFTHCAPPVRRIQTATGPTVHLRSLSAAKKAYPDPEWPSRSSSFAIRCQVGVSGPRVVQAFLFTRYPPPRRRIRTPSGPAVPLHSLPAARKASPDPGRSSRSSSVTIRHQEGVSGPRVAQPFLFTRYPPPGRRRRIPGGPAVHLQSLSATWKAYPDPEWSSRSFCSLSAARQGVSGPRVVQPFIFTRYPLPGGRIRNASGPGVHLHSLSAAKKAYPDPEWPSRSSSLAIRCQVGLSGPRVVQAFIFTRYPPPRRRIRTPSGPAVHLHSLSAARWAYPDREWSSR